MSGEGKYGQRLYGYSTKHSVKGTKLYRARRASTGSWREWSIGYVKNETSRKEGPVTYTFWELQNGDKYYYVDVEDLK